MDLKQKISEMLGVKSPSKALLKTIEAGKAQTVPAEERAVTLDQLFQQLNLYAYSYDGVYFVTIYIDQGLLYALFNATGVLYRAPVEIDEAGTVTLGDLESVQQEFTPVSRSRISIVRQLDGETRFFMVAGTAIINRSGQIDSTKLFDNMVARAEQTGFYPALDFYHLGETDALFEFGQFDFLAREGYCYIGSGLLIKDHPLTEAMLRAWTDEPDAWGASIEFYPDLESVEYLPVARGVEVAVFNDGVNTRISVLPEQDAAHFFTSVVMEQRNMNEKQKQAFLKLMKDDKKANEFLANVGDINQNVQERGLIARAKQTNGAAPTGAQVPAQQPANTAKPNPAPADLPVEFDLDDETIGVIARSAPMAAAIQEALAPLLAQLNGALEKLSAISQDVTGLDEAAVAIEERLTNLEDEQAVEVRTWNQDLPARRKVKVTYRAREAYAAHEDGSAASLADVAENGLAQLKS